MPSWNIHIAQTEALFSRDASRAGAASGHEECSGAVSRIVVDRNAFLFGSILPDIRVGYMVPGIDKPLPYRITHIAEPVPIPKPDEQGFWERYVAPLLSASNPAPRDPASPDSGSADLVEPASLAEEQERVNRTHFPARYEGLVPPADTCDQICPPDRSLLDLVLGAWAHLLADNIWNSRVNEFLDSIGGKPSEQFRIKKQADFDGFGRTLNIDAFPRETAELARAAAAFPQYPLTETQVHDAIVVAHETVRANPGTPHHAPYRLLTDEFFERVFSEVVDTTDRLLAERVSTAN